MGADARSVVFAEDRLSRLHAGGPFEERLVLIHEALPGTLSFVDRIATTVLDQQTRVLKTFVSSNRGESSPLSHYQASLDDAPALLEALETRKPRVVNDLGVYENGSHEHTQRIRQQGYHSSCTFPMCLRDQLVGCVFFNSYRKDCFTPDVIDQLAPFAHLVSQLLAAELTRLRTLLAALRTANDMVHYRDPETGTHLERMSRFARLIACELARSGKVALSDEYIEHLFAFSPLHDVGKISIPDDVLQKPGRLDADEWEVMKTHAARGRAMIEAIARNFGMESFEHLNLLRHIAAHHHETKDGRGYPDGLAGPEIPLEARIVAVADVFDALTSRRPYKAAWDNDRAFRQLRTLAADKLDTACVEALIRERSAVEEVQRTFAEEREEPEEH